MQDQTQQEGKLKWWSFALHKLLKPKILIKKYNFLFIIDQLDNKNVYLKKKLKKCSTIYRKSSSYMSHLTKSTNTTRKRKPLRKHTKTDNRTRVKKITNKLITNKNIKRIKYLCKFDSAFFTNWIQFKILNWVK